MIEIRKATSADSHSLATIGILSWESAVVGWGENTAALRESAHNAYRAFCTDQWTKIILAHENGSILGWGAREKLDNHITDLWIEPQFQGKGAGKALLSEMENNIASAGFADAELDTHANNTPAIGFYEHFGYRVVSLSVKYSDNLGQDIQIVSMRRELLGIDLRAPRKLA